LKTETTHKFAELAKAGKIEFSDTGADIAVNYNLTEEEMGELLHLEYGTVVSSHEELFKVLCKKIIRAALGVENVPV